MHKNRFKCLKVFLKFYASELGVNFYNTDTHTEAQTLTHPCTPWQKLKRSVNIIQLQFQQAVMNSNFTFRF